MTCFRAIRLPPAGKDGVQAELVEMPEADLGSGDVDVAVTFSAVDRADALAACGQLPRPAGLVLGCSLAGLVVRSSHPRWREGDLVIATGHGLGLTQHGGWAERACLPGDWLMPQPDGLTSFQAMTVGSAGLAAMQAALALDYHGVLPEAGPVLVTGATGGVGSLAIIALAAFGFEVTAATGRPEYAGYLRTLGASGVIERQSLTLLRELATERWGAAVDCLGGEVLATLLGTTRRGGAVAAVGDVAGRQLTTELVPFTQRAVALLGIDMLYASRSRREEAWHCWGEHAGDKLDLLASTISLEETLIAANAVLSGRSHGRTLIQLAPTRTAATILH